MRDEYPSPVECGIILESYLRSADRFRREEAREVIADLLEKHGDPVWPDVSEWVRQEVDNDEQAARNLGREIYKSLPVRLSTAIREGIAP